MAQETQTPLRAAARHAGPHTTHPKLAAGAGLTAGGTEGNERLTVLAGLLLIVLLAALGVTIIRIGQLLWLHLFLGLLLIGPVALKMASTGYRFVRYYTHNRRYRVKGPPAPVLRLLAPAIVGLTIVVFASGVVLLFIGPGSALRATVFLIHKVSFIAWIVVTALHVLGHLAEILRVLHVGSATRAEMMIAQATRTRGSAKPAEPSMTERLPGEPGRWLSLATAMVLGAVLAIALIPDFGSWTSPAAAALLHHHHHFH